jgi:hypothetical protein
MLEEGESRREVARHGIPPPQLTEPLEADLPGRRKIMAKSVGRQPSGEKGRRRARRASLTWDTASDLRAWTHNIGPTNNWEKLPRDCIEEFC